MTEHCDEQQLRDLMEDSDKSGNEVAVAHLADCSHCQRELEALAAGDWWWSEAREFIAASETIELQLGDTSILAAGPGASAPEYGWPANFLQAPTQPDLLGRLGKYQVEREIGRGGMGMVLKGFDTELNRTVAIKVLAPHLANSGTARKRFAREARAAAAVVHDHVVAIHGIETSGELPYIVMPYVCGSSLQNYVERHGPLDTKEIVRISMQIAAGLAAAHEQGLVHRDVKPANVLLENDLGRVLITDFGLARAADDASITRSGLVAGTPHYMSPEQANGDPVDHQSDQFSLGSVIHFMATGRAPFRGDGAMAVLHSICHREETPLREMNPDIAEPLAVLTHRLLKKQPSDRFESAAQIRQILADYLVHLQNPTRAGIPVELKQRRRLANYATVPTLVLAALMLFGLARYGVNEFNSPTSAAGSTGLGRPAESHEKTVSVTLPRRPSDLEQEVRALAAGIKSVAEHWRSDPSATVTNDDTWDAYHDSLDTALREAEQSWSDTLGEEE